MLENDATESEKYAKETLAVIDAMNVEYEKKHLEFPKNFPIHELYSDPQELAYVNCQNLHSK